ncbi:MAG: GNAT family N-acetyltransferase [Ramlibacter sp.]|nr:GNAT family N-acetyltransferase [Ramlibacter sp.]
MNEIRVVAVEAFPEPAFTQLQRVVFSEIEGYSALMDDAIALEAQSLPDWPKGSSMSPALRLGAYDGDELVGWSFGWLERGRVFYMANSGVIESHRRRGLYTRLVDAVCDHARSTGAVAVKSQHSVLNNAVIISKLRLGFVITGLSQSAQMGTLVELTRHLSSARQAVFNERVVPFTGTPP